MRDTRSRGLKTVALMISAHRLITSSINVGPVRAIVLGGSGIRVMDASSLATATIGARLAHTGMPASATRGRLAGAGTYAAAARSSVGRCGTRSSGAAVGSANPRTLPFAGVALGTRFGRTFTLDRRRGRGRWRIRGWGRRIRRWIPIRGLPERGLVGVALRLRINVLGTIVLTAADISACIATEKQNSRKVAETSSVRGLAVVKALDLLADAARTCLARTRSYAWCTAQTTQRARGRPGRPLALAGCHVRLGGKKCDRDGDVHVRHAVVRERRVGGRGRKHAGGHSLEGDGAGSGVLCTCGGGCGGRRGRCRMCRRGCRSGHGRERNGGGRRGSCVASLCMRKQCRASRGGSYQSGCTAQRRFTCAGKPRFDHPHTEFHTDPNHRPS